MKSTKIPLDKVSVKPGRGRTAQMPASEIVGRADNYGEILAGLWDSLWPLLQKARTDQDVIDAFEKNPTLDTREFVPNMASLIFRVLNERKFPKRREAQIKFLADSIAFASVHPILACECRSRWVIHESGRKYENGSALHSSWRSILAS